MEVHRRRYELQDKALEFFLSNGKTVFLSFNNNKVNWRCLYGNKYFCCNL